MRAALVHGRREKTPNDPKLSYGPRWRGPCMAGGEGGGQEAGAVTARPVGCSAWLGVWVEWKGRNISSKQCPKRLGQLLLYLVAAVDRCEFEVSVTSDMQCGRGGECELEIKRN